MTRRGTRCIRAAAFLVACAFFLEAATNYEGRRVSEIRFDGPRESLSASELLKRIPLKPGDTLRAALIREAIEKLYETGRFDDIIADATSDGENVILTFSMVNRWFTGGQTIEGVNDPPSATQLLNASRLRLGEEFTEARLTQAAENLKNLLYRNGLYEAKLATDVRRDPETAQADIFFRIEPGYRARFTDPVIHGRTEMSVADVVKASKWKRWWGFGPYHSITESRVESGIARIRRSLEKKNFLMSNVDLAGMEWRPESGVATPTIEIEDGPKVDLRIEGYGLSRGKQRALVPVFQERTVDRDLLAEGGRNLESYLQAKGYFDATVRFTQQKENETEVVRYVVDRGPRYKLTALEIDGNEYFDDATLRERTAVTPATRIRYPNGRFSEQLLRDDADAITALYRSNGFLDAKVTTGVGKDPSGKERDQIARIEVEEGPQTLIGTVTIHGIHPETAESIRSRLQSAEGQPYSQDTISLDRETVLNAYYNQGFTEATFDWQAEPVKDNRVNINIHIVEGPQRFVRRVLVGGLKATDPKLVYDRINLRPGDPLSLGEMLESQKRLYDLGIFARVNAAIQNPFGEEESKFVLFEVEESKKYSYNVGFGAQVGRIGGGAVQNFDSPAGSTGFSPRINAGITRHNLFGVGHSATLQGRLSNIQRRAQLTYLAPHFRDDDDLSLAISGLYDDSRDVRTFAATRIEAAIQLSKRLSRANTVQGRYILRRVSVDPESLKIQPLLIPLLAQPVRLGIAAATFIQDRRDDPIESHKGFYNSVDAGVALKGLGSQSDFARVLARNSSYHALTRELIFARSVTLGIQDRIRGGPLKDIPLPERFFAGGASSHRGFPENQAGPRDLETGFPIGGKALLIFNHELRYPIFGDNLGAVLFHDMGNVYSHLGNLSFRYSQRDVEDFDYMVQSVGLGIRYRTPIGPIRIDLAYSPNSPRFIGFEGTREELLFGGGTRTLQRISQFQFHFSLGQTF